MFYVLIIYCIFQDHTKEHPMDLQLSDAVRASRVYFMASLNAATFNEKWSVTYFRIHPLNVLLRRVIAHPATHSTAMKIAISLRDPVLIEYSRCKREEVIRQFFLANPTAHHMLVVRLMVTNNATHKNYLSQIGYL